MTNNETKTNLIELLGKLDANPTFLDVAKEFVETYDGTKDDLFTAFMMHVVILLMNSQKLDVKAKAFDEMVEKNDEFKAVFDRIKSDYKSLAAGDDIPTPAQSS